MNNSRALVVLLFLLLVFMSLIAKLFRVQVGNHEKYSAKAVHQQNTIYSVKAERGIIYDRNGQKVIDHVGVADFAGLSEEIKKLLKK